MPAGGGTGKIIESTAYDGVSSKRVSPNEREINYMKAGKTIYTSHSKVSGDGKTVTAQAKGVNSVGQQIDATGVYVKQ